MTYGIELVNGITKTTTEDGRKIWAFPTRLFEVRPTVQNTFFMYDNNYTSQAPVEQYFPDIADKLGATDAEGYVDALAEGGYFFEPPASISTAGLATSANQTTGNASLSSIDTKLSSQATASNQTTGNGYLQTIAGAVVTDGIHTAARVSIDEDYLSLNGQISVATTDVKLSLKQTHDNLPLFYDRVNAGTGGQSYNSTTCLTAMTVTSGAVGTDYAIAQSFMRPNYTSGVTHCGEFTLSSFQIQTNVIKRVGLFNGGTASPYNTLDGVFLESNGVDNKIYACYANNTATPTKTEVTSLVPYGVTVDWSKQQAVLIKYLYLGGTAIQFSLLIGLSIYRIAEIQLSNIISTPFILRPNQPVRYEIRSAGGAGTLNQVCATIFKQGDSQIEGITRGVLHPGAINYASAGTEYALFSFRKKSTHLSVEVILTELDIAVATAETFQYRLLRNPTITNAPAYTAETNSAVEYFIGAANTTVTDGTRLHVGTATELANNNTFFPSNLSIGHGIAGASDVFVITIIPRTGGITPTASCGWVEGI